jgi:hypothetical protein
MVSILGWIGCVGSFALYLRSCSASSDRGPKRFLFVDYTVPGISAATTPNYFATLSFTLQPCGVLLTQLDCSLHTWHLRHGTAVSLHYNGLQCLTEHLLETAVTKIFLPCFLLTV